MEKRKNPEKDLRNKSGLFFQIGLLSAMFMTVCAFEYRVKEVAEPLDLPAAVIDDEVIPPITVIKPPPPPPPKPVMHNPVEAEPDEPEIEIPVIKIDPVILPDVPDLPPEEPPVEKAGELPFVIVEHMPEPVGGYEAFYRFVNKKLRYPPEARRIGIGGTVFLSFIVNEKGEMVDLEIARGIGAGCDEEVLRIFKNPPKWHPGKQRGKPVKVKQVIPVKFVLN